MTDFCQRSTVRCRKLALDKSMCETRSLYVVEQTVFRRHELTTVKAVSTHSGEPLDHRLLQA